MRAGAPAPGPRSPGWVTWSWYDDHDHDDDNDDDDVGELPGHDAAGHLPHARRGRALDPLGAPQQAGPDDQVMIMMMMMMIMLLMTRENLDNYQRTGVNNVQENYNIKRTKKI